MELRDVMTEHPTVLTADQTLTDAARAMRDQNIGNVLVERDGQLAGILTDRDLVVRAVANGKGPDTALSDVLEGELHSVSVDTSVDDVISLMSDKAIRRVPVTDGGKAVGIVSIGDLAVQNDQPSLLGDISKASPNNAD